MINNYDNEIIVDFSTEEAIAENKYMEYIDYVFSNMNKADSKEAMKNLVTSIVDISNERKEIIDEYDDLLKETYGALIEALNLLDKNNK